MSADVTATDYEHLDVRVDGRVITATIDNPPINLITRELLIDLLRLTERAMADEATTVLVLQSANPDFFMAHFDVELLVNAPPRESEDRPEELNVFDELCERFRTMAKATICKIAGRVGGGGSEIAMACDMRFAALESARMNQMEVAIGIIPGGGGTRRLPGLIGHNRAAELILGAVDLDAETGERWGYFNRALPAAELDAYVDELAERIGSFDPAAVRGAKASMIYAASDLADGLIEETHIFNGLQDSPNGRELMQRFLDLGGQTLEAERRIEELSGDLNA